MIFLRLRRRRNFKTKRSLKSLKKYSIMDSFKKNLYLEEVTELKQTIEHWDNFFAPNAAPTRVDDWVRLEVLGEPMARKYAWAIPNDRSIRILSAFAPLVEIGCGKGYWSRLLQDRGIDIIPCDKYRHRYCWTKVFTLLYASHKIAIFYLGYKSRPEVVTRRLSFIWPKSFFMLSWWKWHIGNAVL